MKRTSQVHLNTTAKSFTTSRTTIHLTSATAHLRVYVLLKRLPLLFSSIHSILSERSHTANYSSSILKAHIPPLSSLSLYFPSAHTQLRVSIELLPSLDDTQTNTKGIFTCLSLLKHVQLFFSCCL